MKNIEQFIEQYIEETGNARKEFRPADGIGVLFLDENEFIPLHDLAYNSDIGFFRASDFPNQPREAGYVEPPGTRFDVVRVKTFDGNEEYNVYAILPDDGLDPFIIGDIESVEALYQSLQQLIKHGKATLEISDKLYNDLSTWVSVTEAAEQFGIPIITLRKAAERGAEGKASGIAGAKKDGARWVFPLASLKQWLANRPKSGPKPKRQKNAN